jgi:hypothetical protein
MNTKPQFKLCLSPEKELELLSLITAGLAANEGDLGLPTNPDNGEPLEVAQVARIVLEALREDVEVHVGQNPENYYDVANQMPTS